MQCYKFVILIFVLLVWLNYNSFCQTPPIKIDSYDIKVSADLISKKLHVSAQLDLKKADTIAEFQLLLNSKVELGSISCETKDGQLDIKHEFVGKDTLRLTIPREVLSSQSLSLDFKYSLPWGEQKGDMIVLDRGDRWYPLILDQIAKFKLTASVPEGYEVFAPGDLVEKKILPRQARFFWESKIPVFKMSLVIGKSSLFHATILPCGDKKIYFCSSDPDEETKKGILSEACNAMKFYNELLGEYHHDRLTFVEIPGLEGMNIATGLLMVDTSFIDQFEKGYYDQLHLGIAAQWFAAGVFFKFLGKGFWFLQLSLPHYLRLMYLEQAKGEDAFKEGLQKGFSAYQEIAGTEKEVSIFDVDFPNTKEKATAIYGKGPLVIDKVRRQIGNENWEKLIKSIYTDYKGRILTYDEFIKYLAKYDSDGACVSKLQKMLSEKGIPED